MAIKKVWIDENCTACCFCEVICPEVFKLEDVAIVIEGVNFSDYEDQIKEVLIRGTNTTGEISTG